MIDSNQVRHRKTYREAISMAKRLQSELINLVDENLLVDWDDADKLSEVTREIENHLLEVCGDQTQVLPVNVINLLDLMRKILMLADYSYRLRLDEPQKSCSLAMKAE